MAIDTSDDIINVSKESYEHRSLDDESRKSVDGNALDNTKPSFYLILVVLVSSLSHLMFGYDTGYISSALVSLKTALTGKELTYGQKDLITSATSLGAFIGAIFTGYVADKFGRKCVIIGGNVFLIAGAAIQCGAGNLWTMVGGRFVMGFGVGTGSVIAPLYITEISPPKYRGRLVSLSSIIRTGAQIIAYAIGTGLEHVHNGWRILIGISLVPTVLQVFLMIPLPESPRFLVQVGKLDKAREALRKTHSGVDEHHIETKVNELMVACQNSGSFEDLNAWQKLIHKWKALHTVPSNLRGLIIVCGMQGVNQFTGFNSLMYFSGTIFEIAGFKNANAVSIVVAGTNFVFTIVAFYLIDRVGRRVLMQVSLMGMIVALVLCSVAFHFLDITFVNNAAVVHSGGGLSGWGIVILVMMMVYVAFFAVGSGIVPWQQSEVLPMYVRGLGSSMACGTNWAGSLTIASTFLIMMENITPTATFAFFAGISLISLVFVWFCFPELSSLSLEETQMLLSNGFNIKKSIALSKERRRFHKHELETDIESTD